MEDIMLRITDEVMEAIIAHAREESPVEACGYLAGGDGLLDEIIRMTNADESAEHYSFVPEEQFAALKKARAAGKELAAVYHSHPASPARMSAEDLRLAYDTSVAYVIVSLMEERPDVRAFRVEGGGAVEEKIEIADEEASHGRG